MDVSNISYYILLDYENEILNLYFIFPIFPGTLVQNVQSVVVEYRHQIG